MIRRRWGFQSGPNIGKAVNTGKIDYGDTHLSNHALNLGYGFYTLQQGGNLDIGIIEATEITKEGGVILGSSCGISREIIERSEQLIIEVNTSIPSYRGMHDIIDDKIPPYRRPFLITSVMGRDGREDIIIDSEKVDNLY